MDPRVSPSFTATDPLSSMNRSFAMSSQHCHSSLISPTATQRASMSLSPLQTEIVAAANGATVEVPPGLHELVGPISVKRGLRLVGANGSAADCIIRIAVQGARQPAIAVTGASELVLEGVTISLAPYCSPDAVLIVAQGAGSALSATSCFLTGGGIWCKEGARVFVQSSDISTSGREGSRGINIHGVGSVVELHRTIVHDCPSGGLAVCSGASVTLESCELTRNGAAGIAAVSGGQVTARTCTISNSMRGASFTERGTGTLEFCLFENNDLAGLTTEGGAQLSAHNCHVRGGRSSLISVGPANVLLKSCDLSAASVAAAYIKNLSIVTMLRCVVHDNAGSAISCHREGTGTFEDCTFCNSRVGPVISVETSSRPAFYRCKISGGAAGGVTAIERAAPLLEECEVVSNALFALRVTRGSALVAKRCTISGAPVQVSPDSTPMLDGCSIDRPVIQYS